MHCYCEVVLRRTSIKGTEPLPSDGGWMKNEDGLLLRVGALSFLISLRLLFRQQEGYLTHKKNYATYSQRFLWRKKSLENETARVLKTELVNTDQTVLVSDIIAWFLWSWSGSELAIWSVYYNIIDCEATNYALCFQSNFVKLHSILIIFTVHTMQIYLIFICGHAFHVQSKYGKSCNGDFNVIEWTIMLPSMVGRVLSNAVIHSFVRCP